MIDPNNLTKQLELLHMINPINFHKKLELLHMLNSITFTIFFHIFILKPSILLQNDHKRTTLLNKQIHPNSQIKLFTLLSQRQL